MTDTKTICSYDTNKPTVIVINGSAGVGKDTFVSLCQELNDKVCNVSTVDFVKQIAYQCGWFGTKTETDRKFLSDLKDLLEDWNDVPNKKIDEFIQAHTDCIIFVHAREPKNIRYYVKKYNAISLLIKNSRVQKVSTNHADREVEDYDYSYAINNDSSFEDLKKTAEWFLNEITSKENE